MAEKGKPKAGKTEYADANVTAQNLSRDPGVKAQHGSGGTKVVPHNRDRYCYPVDPPGETYLPPVRRINHPRRIP